MFPGGRIWRKFGGTHIATENSPAMDMGRLKLATVVEWNLITRWSLLWSNAHVSQLESYSSLLNMHVECQTLLTLTTLPSFMTRWYTVKTRSRWSLLQTSTWQYDNLAIWTPSIVNLHAQLIDNRIFSPASFCLIFQSLIWLDLWCVISNAEWTPGASFLLQSGKSENRIYISSTSFGVVQCSITDRT